MFLFGVALLVVLLWVAYLMMPAPSGLPILVYQKISVDRHDKLTISAPQVNEQLALIERLGYTPISFSDLRGFISQQRPLPDKPVLLTFDGGYESVYRLAYPLLQKYQFKATIFLPTKYIGKFNQRDEGAEKIMGPLAIKEMTRDLIEVGLQSHQHESYRSYSASQIALDLSECIRTLDQHRCPFVRVFAFPYGAAPADRRTKEAVRSVFQEHGIEFALRIRTQVNAFPLRDVYDLKRIRINGTDSLRQFKAKLKKGRTISFWSNATNQRSAIKKIQSGSADTGSIQGDHGSNSVAKTMARMVTSAERKSERFSREDADAKLGHRVRSVVELDDVAAGTTGRVMEMDEIEKDGFELIVEWDSRVDGKFQHDWFSKEQYECCLVDETN
jgi:peptidoglycan/xylan/chitin deacetylase (PgdA/CDA1 family)